MQKEVQATRRKFLTRLTMLASGAIALGSASGFLAGCGGGGTGTGIRPPSGGGGGTTPGLPPLANIIPLTGQQAASAFQNQFGVPDTLGTQVGTPIQNVAQRLAAALTLDTLIIPKFTLGPDGAPTGVTLRTAKQAGFTQATLNTYIQTLINAKETVVQTDAAGNQKFVSLPVVRVGDRIFNATLKVGNQTFTSPVFQHADGTFGFNSVLFVVPGASEVRQVPSTQAQTDNLPNSGRVTSVIVNRNPYDGHVHYEFTLAATAGFDAQTGDVTLSNAQAVVDLLGPFIKVLSGPTAPTVTQVAASIAVRDPKKCRDAESDAVFTCDEDGNPSTRDDDPWTKEEKNRLKVCGKSKTGSPGGTTG